MKGFPLAWPKTLGEKRNSNELVAAEAGLTPHQIMSISGHKTLAEVTRYTAAADRRKLAIEGMQKIEERTGNGNPIKRFP